MSDIQNHPPFQFSIRALFALTAWCAMVVRLFRLSPLLAIPLAIPSAMVLFEWYQVQNRRCWNLVAIAALLIYAVAIMMPDLGSSHNPPRRLLCKNNLAQIGNALREYHRVNGHFPPAYIAAGNGVPMHSWRVLLLPYLDHQAVYDQYRFDEPWNGPHNRQLSIEKLACYHCASEEGNRTDSSYLAVVGPQTAWPYDKSVSLTDIERGDGSGQTILLIEAAGSGINWLEPRDLDFDSLAIRAPGVQPPSIGSSHAGIYALLADGSVELIESNVALSRLKEAVKIGGERHGLFDQ